MEDIVEEDIYLRLFLKEKGITDEKRIERIKKITIERKIKAKKFWEERRKKHHENINGYTLEELKEKHKNELSKIHNKEEAENIGIMIMGDFYLGGFSSRSNSRKMSELVGYETNYMDFYGSSCYYYMMKGGI